VSGARNIYTSFILRPCAFVAAVAAAVAAMPAAALTTTPVWDASLTALPDAAIVENAFNAVASDYTAVFSSPVNVYINVGWGEVANSALPSNAVGASSTNLYGYFT
jgi:2-methylisocitrate lyase-like PEP mutase family enzyme